MSRFLYLIECADDSVYTGITTDVAARFDEHASGKGARYTRSRKPRAVLASFPLPDRSSASRRVLGEAAHGGTEAGAGGRVANAGVGAAVVAVDTSGDEVGLKAGARGGRRRRTSIVREKTVETGKSPKNAGKAGKAEKVDKPAKPPSLPRRQKPPRSHSARSPTTMGSQKTSSRDTSVKGQAGRTRFVERKGACSQRQTHHERTRRCRARIASRRRPAALAAEAPAAPVVLAARSTKDAPSTARRPRPYPPPHASDPNAQTKPRGLLRRHARLAFRTNRPSAGAPLLFVVRCAVGDFLVRGFDAGPAFDLHHLPFSSALYCSKKCA